MTRDEQRHLLARACAGDLPPGEAARLLDACRRDPALLAEFSRLTVVERLLAHGNLYPDDGAFVREVRARLQAERSKIVALPHRWSWRRVSWTWAAAAAAVLLAAAFWTFRSEPVAARIVRIESVTWVSNERPRQVGKAVEVPRLQLAGGLVELKFARGATVIVEGPADFEVRGPQHAVLHQGRAVVRLPKGTKGFILDSPRGRLVDQGTEFGVGVGPSGDTEVHVLEGLVEAHPDSQAQTIELSVNQAARLTQGNVEQIAADAGSFITDLPPPSAGAIGYLHWSFDEGQSIASTNRGRDLGASNALARLRSFPETGAGPGWIPGQFGSGLSFDGTNDYVECEFPGIPGGQPRTVAFWVKVPRGSQTNEGYGIINWGTLGRPGMAWQISVNPETKDGPLGRLRVGVHGGWVVGTTDLRDDRWHHCAVVMYGGHRPDAGTHILLYVDGDLEPAARKALQEIRTETTGALAHNMWLGRNLSFQSADSRIAGGPFFRGCVDEVFVFNAALNQEQLRSLMKSNRLPPGPSQVARSGGP
jgi:hypothetical protein